MLVRTNISGELGVCVQLISRSLLFWTALKKKKVTARRETIPSKITVSYGTAQEIMRIFWVRPEYKFQIITTILLILSVYRARHFKRNMHKLTDITNRKMEDIKSRNMMQNGSMYR